MILKSLYEKKIIQQGNFTLKSGETFRVWKDRKLVGIGNVMTRQIRAIYEWADIVFIYPISGGKSVENID